MPSEIELKLELSAEAAEQAAALPWLGGPAKKETLVSVYFDTAKRKLHAHGVSLRVRHQGDRRVQTIKVENTGRRGAFGRDQWEHDIACDRPDLRFAAGTALANLGRRKLKRKLRPVFKTVIERTATRIHCERAALEFALDRGLIQGGGRRQPVNEIELEIDEGDPSALAAIAERLARSVPVSYSICQRPNAATRYTATKPTDLFTPYRFRSIHRRRPAKLSPRSGSRALNRCCRTSRL